MCFNRRKVLRFTAIWVLASHLLGLMPLAYANPRGGVDAARETIWRMLVAMCSSDGLHPHEREVLSMFQRGLRIEEGRAKSIGTRSTGRSSGCWTDGVGPVTLGGRPPARIRPDTLRVPLCGFLLACYSVLDTNSSGLRLPCRHD